MVIITVLLMLISSFLLRPTSLGQEYTSIALILLSVAFFIHVIYLGMTRQKIKFTEKNIIIFIIFVIFWLFILIQGAIMNAKTMDWIIKAVIAHLVTMTLFLVLLSNPKTNKLYFKSLFIILLINATSYSITILLIVFGFDINSLFMFRTYVDTDIYYLFTSYGKVLFPFTQIYGIVRMGSMELPRALGFFREAGIYQMFIIFALFNVNRYFKKNLFLVYVLLIIGVFSTFSTAGLVLLVLIFSLKLFLDMKPFSSFFTLGISFLAFIFAPVVGFLDKSETSIQSFNDRLASFYEGIERLIDNPFGIGLYNTLDSSNRNLGINLFGMSSMIGVIGVVLVLLIYFLPLISYSHKKLYFISIMPFFLTLLTSQPILDAPLVYVMLLADFACNYNIKNEENEKYLNFYIEIG